jgi:hypothetical protein
MVFLGPKVNAEFVPKFHFALRASHAALPMVTSKCRPNLALPELNQNVTLMQQFWRKYQNSDRKQ